jgi:hypothetical protein
LIHSMIVACSQYLGSEFRIVLCRMASGWSFPDSQGSAPDLQGSGPDPQEAETQGMQDWGFSDTQSQHNSQQTLEMGHPSPQRSRSRSPRQLGVAAPENQFPSPQCFSDDEEKKKGDVPAMWQTPPQTPATLPGCHWFQDTIWNAFLPILMRKGKRELARPMTHVDNCTGTAMQLFSFKACLRSAFTGQ